MNPERARVYTRGLQDFVCKIQLVLVYITISNVIVAIKLLKHFIAGIIVTTVVTAVLTKSYFGLGMDRIVFERFIIKDNVTISTLLKGKREELFFAF